MAKANTTTGRKTPKAAPIVVAEPEVFGPAINSEQIYTLEEVATTESRGQQRRILLIVLSKSAEDLVKISEKEPDLFREMREMVQAFLPHARALAEMGQAAVTRLMVTDMRRDTSKEDEEAAALLKEGSAA